MEVGSCPPFFVTGSDCTLCEKCLHRMSSESSAVSASKLVTASVALGHLQVQITVKRTSPKETWPPWSVKVSDGAGGEVSLDARAIVDATPPESPPTSVVDDIVLNSLGFDSRGDKLNRQNNANNTASSSSNHSDLLQPFYDHLSDSVDFLTSPQPLKLRKTNENHHDQLQHTRRQLQQRHEGDNMLPPDISSSPPNPPQPSSASFLEAFTAPPNRSLESSSPLPAERGEKRPSREKRILLAGLITEGNSATDTPSASTEPNLSASSSQTVATSETLASLLQSRPSADKKTDSLQRDALTAITRDAQPGVDTQDKTTNGETRRPVEKMKRVLSEVERSPPQEAGLEKTTAERSVTSSESSAKNTVTFEAGTVASPVSGDQGTDSKNPTQQSSDEQASAAPMSRTAGSSAANGIQSSPRVNQTSSPNDRSSARDPVTISPEDSELLKSVQWPQVTKPGSELPTLYCHLCYLKEKAFKKIEATSPHGNRVYFRHRACSASYGSGEAFPKPLVDLYVAHFLTKRQSLGKRKA